MSTTFSGMRIGVIELYIPQVEISHIKEALKHELPSLTIRTSDLACQSCSRFVEQ